MTDMTEKVDKFLYNILFANQNGCTSNPPNPAADFLQKSEETIISFIQSDERVELEFPALNSFYRRIIHCLGRRYNLVHRVEVTNVFNSSSTLRRIYLTKPVGNEKLLTILKSSDWIEGIQREAGLIETTKTKKTRKTKDSKKTREVKKTKDSNVTTKFKILKRETTSNTTVSPVTSTPPITSPLLVLDGLTLEEREAKYQAARDRIFEGFTATEPQTGETKEGSTAVRVGADTESAVVPSETVSAKDVNNKIESSTAEELASQSQPHKHSSALNPDAVPFSFNAVVLVDDEEPSQEEACIEINHIYTITSTITPLTSDDFNEIIASHPTATIKTHSLPSEFAFLLTNDTAAVFSNNDKWTISKWIPEFYLD